MNWNSKLKLRYQSNLERKYKKLILLRGLTAFHLSIYHSVKVLSTALAKHHANGDTSMVTEIVNLCPIM